VLTPEQRAARSKRNAAAKRRWRRCAANREAEAEAHRLRRDMHERLLESMRDTLRHIDDKEQR
jgi:hypothetical protein